MGGLGSGGGPLGHVMAVDFLFYFFLSTIVPPISLFAKWNVALRSLHPPPRKSKVSWSRAQINVNV